MRTFPQIGNTWEQNPYDHYKGCLLRIVLGVCVEHRGGCAGAAHERLHYGYRDPIILLDRGKRVAESVPTETWNVQAVAGWLNLAANQVTVIEDRPCAVWKEQADWVFRFSSYCLSTLTKMGGGLNRRSLLVVLGVCTLTWPR